MQVILGGLEGKEETKSNSESESGRWGGSGEEEGYIGGFAMHWEDLGNVSQSGDNVLIDNLKSKAKEVNWVMEPVGSRKCSLL